jgi:hypothetical protein
VGAKSKIQSPPKSKQLQLTKSRVLDELERRGFQHFTQHGQGFLVSLLQVPQSRNIFAVLLFGEKIPLSRQYYT